MNYSSEKILVAIVILRRLPLQSTCGPVKEFQLGSGRTLVHSEEKGPFRLHNRMLLSQLWTTSGLCTNVYIPLPEDKKWKEKSISFKIGKYSIGKK